MYVWELEDGVCSGVTPAEGYVSGHKAPFKPAMEDYLSRKPGKGVSKSFRPPSEERAETNYKSRCVVHAQTVGSRRVAEWRPLHWSRGPISSSQQGHAPWPRFLLLMHSCHILPKSTTGIWQPPLSRGLGGGCAGALWRMTRRCALKYSTLHTATDVGNS